jgi:hypothetical protein
MPQDPPRRNVFAEKYAEEEHVEDLLVMIHEGRARIVSKYEMAPFNGRRRFKMTVELEE